MVPYDTNRNQVTNLRTIIGIVRKPGDPDVRAPV
jgi:hypothetical protein